MKEMKTWGDFASNYSLVLFNNCVNEEIAQGAVLQEWLESHECESQEAEMHLNNCEIPDCEKCKEYKNDYGESPECTCEPYQWYAIAVSEGTQEWLNKKYNLDIFYSDTLGIFILPVYHFGTSWDYVSLSENSDNE